MKPTFLNKLKLRLHCKLYCPFHVPHHTFINKKLTDIYCYTCNYGKDKELTIKDCKCKMKRKILFWEFYFKRCKFHQECIGTPCANGINICDNPKHQEK